MMVKAINNFAIVKVKVIFDKKPFTGLGSCKRL